jgi:hypothetical protein
MSVPQRLELRRESPELLQVQSGQPGKTVGPVRSEAKPHRPQVVAVLAPLHQPAATAWSTNSTAP